MDNFSKFVGICILLAVGIGFTHAGLYSIKNKRDSLNIGITGKPATHLGYLLLFAGILVGFCGIGHILTENLLFGLGWFLGTLSGTASFLIIWDNQRRMR